MSLIAHWHHGLYVCFDLFRLIILSHCSGHVWVLIGHVNYIEVEILLLYILS